jgi:hypothetical protein
VVRPVSLWTVGTAPTACEFLLALAAGCTEGTAPTEVWIVGGKHAASGQRLAALWRNGVWIPLETGEYGSVPDAPSSRRP